MISDKFYDQYVFPLIPGKLEELMKGEVFQKALEVSQEKLLNRLKGTSCCEACAINAFKRFTSALEIPSLRYTFVVSTGFTIGGIVGSVWCFRRGLDVLEEQQDNKKAKERKMLFGTLGLVSFVASMIFASSMFVSCMKLQQTHRIAKLIIDATL